MKDELAVEEAPAKKTRKTTAKKAEGEKAPAKKATTKKASTKKAAKPATVTVTLKKSLNGRLQNQKDCAAALGLKKVGDVKVHPENAATMGKIAKISHLVEITK
ncbi:MAG: 50S ribosomal protein L30 [Oscillospiraceae bacterium]|nr:50S ribosomal protein L30 [Oscillospiraceae bacterium]MBQ5325420.1 50S ribosomal protein L30 [Oscillospiraceae bacterium]